MAEKQTNKQRLKEITDSIEAGIQELFQSEKYMNYLRTMSRFHKYSFNNTMLIHLQKPDATLVTGYNKWEQKFNRHVKRGEKGIKIIAPTPFKKLIEQEKLDPDTKLPMRDKDGNIIMEEKEVKIPMFKPVVVFDVSQTEGEPLPTLAAELKGDVRHYEIFMEALRRSSPVPVEFKAIDKTMDGYFNLDDQEITLREGMSEVQTICAAVHEITHAKLHNYEQARFDAAAGGIVPPEHKDRNTEEVEAESVSFAVCSYYGIETGANSFGYIASWSGGKELKELKASLETINRTADGLITDIDRNFTEICKERGIDLSNEQAGTAPIVPGESVSSAGQTPVVGPDEPSVSADKLSEDLRDTVLDEYPMPDPAFLPDELEQSYGYADGDLLPLSKDRALELIDKDMTVYILQNGENPSMAFDREEIMEQSSAVIFAVPREEWEASQDFRDAVADRMNHQQEREAAFLNHVGDCFAIYQLKRGEETRDLRYMPLPGQGVDKAFYELAYTGKLTPGQDLGILDKLWERFNTDHPADYCRPSMSMSDIVALKQDGVVSCHYVDRLGFTMLHDFLQPENYLKSAEMSVEDDLSMIDGIINNGSKDGPSVAELEAQVKAGQSISLMDLAGAVQREMGDGIIDSGPKQPTVAELEEQVKAGQTISLTELANAAQREKQRKPAQEKKPSILAKIRRPLPDRSEKKAAPEKSAEKEFSR